MMTHPTFTAIDCSPNGTWIAGSMLTFRPDYISLAVTEAKTFQDGWDTEIGDQEFNSGVSKVVYSPSGNRIAVGFFCVDESYISLSLYNSENGKDVGYYDVKKTIRSIAFSPNGKYLAALTDSVTVWPVIS